MAVQSVNAERPLAVGPGQSPGFPFPAPYFPAGPYCM
jgi:hypothetical protein